MKAHTLAGDGALCCLRRCFRGRLAHRGFVQQDLQGLTGRLTSKVGDIVRKRDQQDTAAAITA